jgi:glycosyltransferase involved in cell wall biosynthesis
VIAVSGRTASDLAALGVRRDRIKVVPNGIPLGYIRSIPAAGEGCDVIFAGRLIKDKHVDVLLRACQGLPVRLTVIGDGPERAGLEAMAAELKVQATFAGFLAEEELIARMKAAQVFVLPSTREGFSITTLEAMACGLPVITVEAPRNYARDLIEDGVTGRVVPPDEKHIGEAIMGLFTDDAGRSRMNEACRKIADGYDWDAVTRMLENNYRL